MNRIVLAAVIAAGLAVRALAQTPAAPLQTDLAFDVVSVKPDTQGPTGPTFFRVQPGGRFDATNVPVTMLITQAYRIQPFQLTGAPSWAAADRFDISAKAPDGVNLQATPNPDPKAPPSPMQLMLRAMLADRFKLKFHMESRDTPSYDLTLARSDGKLGPNITKSDTDCAAEAAAARARGDAPALPAFGQPMKCGLMMSPGNLNGGSVALNQFASVISQQTGRTVVDRTGLTGNFNIMLTFTPDRLPPRPAGASADGPITFNGVSIDPNGPSLLTAIQEQLGLKLEPSKTTLDVLVVDSVERPSED